MSGGATDAPSRGGFGGGGGGATGSANLSLSRGGFGGGGGGSGGSALSAAGGFGGGAGGSPIAVGGGGFGGGGGGTGGTASPSGFGAGAGASGILAAPGGGGAGFGGAAFVREGGSLQWRFSNTAAFDATAGNAVAAGPAGGAGAQPGQAAGSDAYVDLGSTLDLRLGSGDVRLPGSVAGRGGIAVTSTARSIVSIGDWSGLRGDVRVFRAGLAQISANPIDLTGRSIDIELAPEPAIGALGSAGGPIVLGGDLVVRLSPLPTAPTRYRIAQGIGPTAAAAFPGAFDSITLPPGVSGALTIEPFGPNAFLLALVAAPDAVFANGFEP